MWMPDIGVRVVARNPGGGAHALRTHAVIRSSRVTTPRQSEPQAGATVPLSEGGSRRLGRLVPPDPRVSLVFFHRDGGTVVSLDPGASVVVGREPPADVVVADPSLSRRHARFSWADGEVVVEDLG